MFVILLLCHKKKAFLKVILCMSFVEGHIFVKYATFFNVFELHFNILLQISTYSMENLNSIEFIKVNPYDL